MKEFSIQQILEHITPEDIIKTLDPFILDSRKKTIENSLAQRITSIQLAVENPEIPQNALATLRTCVAFGLSTAHIISPPNKNGITKSITKGSASWVEIHYHKTLQEFLSQQTSMLLVGAITNAKTSLHEIPIDKPMCIILGNEKDGLTKECIQHTNLTYTIPMQGMVNSFNLSVSAGISLYDLVRRRRQYIQKKGDLDPAQKQKLRAQYYLHSINSRLTNQLFHHYFI